MGYWGTCGAIFVAIGCRANSSGSQGMATRLQVRPNVGPILMDRVLGDVYRAATGLAPWPQALKGIVDHFGLWAVHFFGMDKRTGAVIFSFEVGNHPPEA